MPSFCFKNEIKTDKQRLAMGLTWIQGSMCIDDSLKEAPLLKGVEEAHKERENPAYGLHDDGRGQENQNDAKYEEM